MPRKKAQQEVVTAPQTEAANAADAEDPAADGLDRVEFEPVEDAGVAPTPATGGDEPPGEPPLWSPEWTPYVLARLADDETFDGQPTVAGLRRVAAELLGDIVESTAEVVQAPNTANGNWATVRAQVVIKWTKGVDVPEPRAFVGLADVYAGNTEEKFARFPCSVAETRAEGRALRKALMLARHVVAAEEMTTVPVEESGADGLITPFQINFIDLKSQQLDVSVLDFINSGKGQYKSINDVPYDVAHSMVAHLSKLQKNKAGIPDHLRGYQPNWR